MISEYKNFTDGLARLCERGIIGKDNKNLFSHYRTDNPCELIFSACSDLTAVFGASERASAEYSALCSAVEKFILSLKPKFVNFDRHFAVVCAYIRVTEKANASGDAAAFKIMSERLEEYNKSLHNIKYGRELFSE